MDRCFGSTGTRELIAKQNDSWPTRVCNCYAEYITPFIILKIY